AEACFSLKPAATIERADLVTRLLQLGYHQVSVVENPGEYAVRGGIVDLYSTAHEEPRRLDFLGNTIETIRLFDPATQKSSGRAPLLRVLPAREPSVSPTTDALLDYLAAPPMLIADEPAALREHAEAFQGTGARSLVIVARSRGQVDRLKGLFLEHDLPAEPLGAKPVTTLGAHAPYALVQGDLSGGLLGLRGPGDGAAPLPLSIIAEDELFAKGGRHK